MTLPKLYLPPFPYGKEVVFVLGIGSVRRGCYTLFIVPREGGVRRRGFGGDVIGSGGFEAGMTMNGFWVPGGNWVRDFLLFRVFVFLDN